MNIRKEIFIGITLLIIILILYSIIDFWKATEEKKNIENFIKEDLRNKHPDADVIEILEMEKKVNDEGKSYYSIKAKVTEGLNTPCPVRIHYYYNYPVQNFVAQPPEYVTQDCKVCQVEPCTLAFEEEAIIASHTLEGTEEIGEFLSENPDAYPTVEKQENGWLVHWIKPSTLNGYAILIDFHGDVIEIEEINPAG